MCSVHVSIVNITSIAMCFQCYVYFSFFGVCVMPNFLHSGIAFLGGGSFKLAETPTPKHHLNWRFSIVDSPGKLETIVRVH